VVNTNNFAFKLEFYISLIRLFFDHIRNMFSRVMK
jgi:hypothetical protein